MQSKFLLFTFAQAEEHASSDETPAVRPLMSFYREAVLFVSTSQLNGIICGAEMRAEDVFGFFVSRLLSFMLR